MSWELGDTLQVLNTLAGLADNYQQNKLNYEINQRKLELDEEKFDRLVEKDKFDQDIKIISEMSKNVSYTTNPKAIDQRIEVLNRINPDNERVESIKNASILNMLGMKEQGEKIIDFNETMIETKDKLASLKDEHQTGNFSSGTDGVDKWARDLELNLLNNAKFYSQSQKMAARDLIEELNKESNVYDVISKWDDDGNLTSYAINQANFDSTQTKNAFTGATEPSKLGYANQAVEYYKAGLYDKALKSLDNLPGQNSQLVKKASKKIDDEKKNYESNIKSIYNTMVADVEKKGGSFDDLQGQRWTRIKNIGTYDSSELEKGTNSRIWRELYDSTGGSGAPKQEDIDAMRDDIHMFKNHFDSVEYESLLEKKAQEKSDYMLSNDLKGMELRASNLIDAIENSNLPDDYKKSANFDKFKGISISRTGGEKLQSVDKADLVENMGILMKLQANIYNAGDLGDRGFDFGIMSGESYGLNPLNRQVALGKDELKLLKDEDASLTDREYTYMLLANRMKYVPEARREVMDNMQNQSNGAVLIDESRELFLDLFTRKNLYHSESGKGHTSRVNMEKQTSIIHRMLNDLMIEMHEKGMAKSTIPGTPYVLDASSQITMFTQELLERGWSEKAIENAVAKIAATAY